MRVCCRCRHRWEYEAAERSSWAAAKQCGWSSYAAAMYRRRSACAAAATRRCGRSGLTAAKWPGLSCWVLATLFVKLWRRSDWAAV